MSTPAFIDSVHAAELLRTTQDAVLDLVKEGRLRTYGGRASNPFVRSADVLALAPQLGVQEGSEPARRTKSPSARVRTRLTADARWSEVSEQDIRDWAARADPASKQAARKAAVLARERLQSVLRSLDELG